MHKFILFILILLGLPFVINAQNDTLWFDTTKVYTLPEDVTVRATRAQDIMPTTFKTISSETLEKEDLGLDLPVLLERTPSLVSTSDAGNGVGYTFLRIRGSDQSRINVTINGVPLNDAESQGVFWVNTPDIVSSVGDIQIQRGVGTSTNGSSAFGATVNLQTATIETSPYAEAEVSAGSFATNKQNIRFGTGLLANRFIIQGRASRIASQGYIDRASANMWSYQLQASYKDDKTIMHLLHFNGRERTYQAWFGIDSATLENDRTFNPAGTDFGQREEPYENEVDDYGQAHYQFHLSRQIKRHWMLNTTLHYTKGSGFFEQYNVAQPFSTYGIPNPIIGGDTLQTTDVIRRRWLDNHFYGIIASAQYKRKNTTLTMGAGWHQYDGLHFGELIWMQNAGSSQYEDRFYEAGGLKTDASAYVKLLQTVAGKYHLFADVQYRNVGYTIDGTELGPRPVFADADYNFVNPKVGLTVSINKNQQVYASFAMAAREPARQDFIDRMETPKPEFLRNVEAGYKWNGKKVWLSANYFFMGYRDQLVLTGSLNDVGTPIRDNVDRSYRTGVELDVDYRPLENLRFTGNLTGSIHRIASFTTTDFSGNTRTYQKTPIAFSPNWIGGLDIEYKAWDQLTIGLLNKVVGAQYLDNTGRDRFRLDPYFVQDVRLSWKMPQTLIKNLEWNILVRNITNRKYVSNGYVFFDTPYYYPQAGTHFLLGLRMAL